VTEQKAAAQAADAHGTPEMQREQTNWIRDMRALSETLQPVSLRLGRGARCLTRGANKRCLIVVTDAST